MSSPKCIVKMKCINYNLASFFFFKHVHSFGYEKRYLKRLISTSQKYLWKLLSIKIIFSSSLNARLEHASSSMLGTDIDITMLSIMRRSLLPDKTHTLSQTPFTVLFFCFAQAGTVMTLEALEITS